MLTCRNGVSGLNLRATRPAHTSDATSFTFSVADLFAIGEMWNARVLARTAGAVDANAVRSIDIVVVVNGSSSENNTSVSVYACERERKCEHWWGTNGALK